VTARWTHVVDMRRRDLLRAANSAAGSECRAAGKILGIFVDNSNHQKCSRQDRDNRTWRGCPPRSRARWRPKARSAARSPWPWRTARSPADIAVAITGVAGPSPDEDGNPVGRVCIAVARRGLAAGHLERDYGDIGREPCANGPWRTRSRFCAGRRNCSRGSASLYHPAHFNRPRMELF